MDNVGSNLDRLEYHPGVPCGKKTFCPVWRQDKYKVHAILEPLGLSAPTISIVLTSDCYEDPHVIKLIER